MHSAYMIENLAANCTDLLGTGIGLFYSPGQHLHPLHPIGTHMDSSFVI